VLCEGAEVGYAWLVVNVDAAVWAAEHGPGVVVERGRASGSLGEGFR
jgi:hypothetical protein